MQTISQILAQELNCRQEYIENVIALLDEGNTIPFIARYRKEQHGAMDDTALRTLETRLQYLRNLAQRREEHRTAMSRLRRKRIWPTLSTSARLASGIRSILQRLTRTNVTS